MQNGLEKKHFLVEQYREILSRKTSIGNVLQRTADGLANAFARDQKPPEALIYELFKIPNKNEASVGKLLSVSFTWRVRFKLRLRLRHWFKLVSKIKLFLSFT